MKITLSEEILRDFDRSEFSPHYENIFLRAVQQPAGDAYPFWAWDRYHRYYRILGYLSTLFNDKVLVDIGTRAGHSACSLAFNENNIVYTYNSEDQEIENDAFSNFENIRPYVLTGGNQLDNILGAGDHREHLLKSSLIFMDVDPHDGGKESELFDFLTKNDYKGITLWDDIQVQLADWWKKTVDQATNENFSTYNLKEYSWSEGSTGVICFGEQEFILE